MEYFVFRAKIAAVQVSNVYFLSFVTMWSIVVYIRIRIMQIWRKEGLTGLLQIIYLKNVTLFTHKMFRNWNNFVNKELYWCEAMEVKLL